MRRLSNFYKRAREFSDWVTDKANVPSEVEHSPFYKEVERFAEWVKAREGHRDTQYHSRIGHKVLEFAGWIMEENPHDDPNRSLWNEATYVSFSGEPTPSDPFTGKPFQPGPVRLHFFEEWGQVSMSVVIDGDAIKQLRDPGTIRWIEQWRERLNKFQGPPEWHDKVRLMEELRSMYESPDWSAASIAKWLNDGFVKVATEYARRQISHEQQGATDSDKGDLRDIELDAVWTYQHLGIVEAKALFHRTVQAIRRGEPVEITSDHPIDRYVVRDKLKAFTRFMEKFSR